VATTRPTGGIGVMLKYAWLSSNPLHCGCHTEADPIGRLER
jgi:hypothetical protein